MKHQVKIAISKKDPDTIESFAENYLEHEPTATYVIRRRDNFEDYLLIFTVKGQRARLNLMYYCRGWLENGDF